MFFFFVFVPLFSLSSSKQKKIKQHKIENYVNDHFYCVEFFSSFFNYRSQIGAKWKLKAKKRQIKNTRKKSILETNRKKRNTLKQKSSHKLEEKFCKSKQAANHEVRLQKKSKSLNLGTFSFQRSLRFIASVSTNAFVWVQFDILANAPRRCATLRFHTALHLKRPLLSIFICLSKCSSFSHSIMSISQFKSLLCLFSFPFFSPNVYPRRQFMWAFFFLLQIKLRKKAVCTSLLKQKKNVEKK